MAIIPPTAMDLYPTILRLCNVKVPASVKLDSNSLPKNIGDYLRVVFTFRLLAGRIRKTNIIPLLLGKAICAVQYELHGNKINLALSGGRKS